MSIAHYFETMDYGPAPEADGEARAWLKRHDATFGHFIAGKFVAPASGKHLTTIEPATGKTLAKIAQGIAADVEAAVGAARSAQSSWAKLGGHGRARHLYALARMLQRHARLFSVLEAIDNGKPIRETRDLDVPLAARHFLYHAGWAQLQDREFADHVPVGVIGQIIPWNFPLLMLAWKIAPALATGNTVVLKPAEFTSLTALLFAELAAEAGLPPGVLNVVTGDGATGALLVENPGVDKIAFTGSTEVGRLIRQSTAGSGKSLTLELGGKSPFIVFDDADIDGAVEGVVGGTPCAPGIDLDQQCVTKPGNFTALCARGVARRLADDIGLERTAHLDQPQQRLALEPHHGRHKPARGRHTGGEERAGAALASDQAQSLPAVERLANGRATNAQPRRKSDLGRQSVANSKAGAVDHLGQSIEHGNAARRRVDPLEIVERVTLFQKQIGGHSCGIALVQP